VILPRWLRAALLALPVLAGCAPGEAPEVSGPSRPAAGLAAGAVAAPEPHAARVGIDVLQRGGTAADAAVAVHFALAVTFPYAGNIGGGGFALVHAPDVAPAGPRALDFREVAPSGAHPELFLDDQGKVVEGLSLHSHLAAGVPGSVRGMWELHRQFGRLEWDTLIAPAVELAREGFVLDEWTARSFAETAAELDRLPPRLRRATDFGEHFAGRPGDRFRQPELARTLARIAAEGPDGFYRGETARRIVEEMQRGGGLIDAEDLADYRAVWREPVGGTFRGYRVVSMPPPSSGGIALVQLLDMFEQFPLPGLHTVDQVHLVAEIEKRVFADRSVHLGDPDFHEVPTADLLDEAYIRARVQDIRLDRRTDPAAVAAGEPRTVVPEGGSTLHFSVVDGRGRAVSCTTTINAGYGSGIVVDGAGFLLNNEMDDFAAKPGVPNLYGVTGGEANKVEAGKRPLSSMSPTLVYRPDGSLWLALGTPGGPTIFTTVFQVLLHRIDYGLDLETAIGAPRFHHQWPPIAAEADPLFIERPVALRLPEPTLAGLERLGYAIVPRKPLGNVQAVEVQEDGRVAAAADPRGIGVGLTVD
jgi:gamma-glutamyltranspeptidase/glutathione hydrolase